MAEDSSNSAVNSPKTPNPALKKLDRLIGTWKITGPDVEGESTFEWMEGGFFFIHRFEMTQGGHKVKGIEYAGFDEATQTLRSHVMDTTGSSLTYTWDVEGDTLWYWFGDKGSSDFSRSTFSPDGNTLTGRWQWYEADGKPGGYEFTMTRVK
jgi:hypothetical protein